MSKLVFDTHGNEKQKECVRQWLNPSISDIVYGGSKGSAKSFTGCSLIFGDAFIYPQTHYFIARQKLNDLRKHTIPSIHEVFNIWGITSSMYNYNGQDNFFELYNGSKVFLLDAKYLPSDPLYYRFGSMQMTRGWIEEAGEFDEEAKNNLMASIGRWNNDKYNLPAKLLQTCNPSKNYLYRDYYKKYKAGTLEPWKCFIQALPQDNKKQQAGYLENLKRTLSNNQKERLLYGNWEYDDNPNVLCDYDSIIGMFENNHVAKTGVRYITADIARFGSDKAIIAVWDGWTVIDLHIFGKSATTEIQTCINAMRSKYGIPKHNCIADEDGVGGGVVDNCGIKGFVNNSRAIEEPAIIGKEVKNYQNLQAQCAYKLAEIINSNSLYIQMALSSEHKDEIVQDLEALESYDTDGDSKLKILPKEKVKEKIGRSPDWRDVLLMRVYFELDKPFKRPKSSISTPQPHYKP